ncbi:flavin reductase family protein [Delftia sp. PS-11]|uniref:flavin reductase family protein n=1 Tax=Delftia sp. PS-11 TaxID=2767222 RepID=UPI00245724B2|nr:flavin reductase family protein [Delftia sp. PS-11]KAJ8745635.1 flavin reductase family protein [Delftia sp. PS-11]
MNSALPPAALAHPAPFSSREFRDALGQFATGVTIVTARSPQGHPVGVTVSSFNSVSLAPPLVLWSMALSAASLPVFQNCSHYAIHVLSAGQKPLAELFARKGVDRFAQTPWRSSVQGVPLLDGAAAVFECRNRNRHEEGDHVIFIGEVEQCNHQTGLAPLLYHAGRMHTDGLPG